MPDETEQRITDSRSRMNDEEYVEFLRRATEAAEDDYWLEGIREAAQRNIERTSHTAADAEIATLREQVKVLALTLIQASALVAPDLAGVPIEDRLAATIDWSRTEAEREGE